MEFAILGPLQVRCGDVVVDVRRGLPRTILTYLLLHPGDTVRSEVLADVLWGDDQPMNPANALQTQISYLRRQLSAHVPVQPIITRPGGYALVVDRECIDAHRFDAVVHRAAKLAAEPGTDHDAVITMLDEALSWWRGDALEDVVGEPFAIGEATRLGELRLAAIELRTEAALALGRHHQVAGDLAALVVAHPLRERLHAQLMLALYRSGRQADALRAFAHARERLVEDLGIEPGPELRTLEQRILDHDPSLLLPVDDVAEAPSRRPVEADHRGSAVADATTASTRAGLPAAVTPLIGRDVELERVRRLLDRSRAVTLTGPAGAGKSRLAIEVARTIAETHDVWYADLGDVDDPGQVAAAVASAIDVPSVPGQDPVGAVAASLATRTGLLVLDTCERVVGAAAAMVGRVLRDAAGIRVLATSRRPLNVGGEIAWPVPPLALGAVGATARELSEFASVQLFVERAQAVQPDFELSDAVADDVAAICMALDGLPLAIELAAARIDVLAPRSIRDRLVRRFDLLVGGGSDASPRQQSLRSAIGWSIDLLTDDERATFARLGVLLGTFDLDAAACVAGMGDTDEFLAVITALVRHSLISRTGDHRFRLLDTLRAYALELLEGLDADDTRRRHAHCFVGVAEAAEAGIRGTEQLAWLERTRADLPNHRAALEWMVATGDGDGAARLAGSLGWFWTLDGMLADACVQLAGVLEFPELAPERRAKVAWSLALAVASLGDLSRAELLAEAAIRDGRAAGAAVQVAYGLNALAVAQWGLGRLDDADRSRDEAIALFDAHDDVWGAGVCRVLRGRTALDRLGAGASDAVADGMRAADLAGDRHLMGMAHEQMARLALDAGRPEEALDHANRSLHLHDELGYVEGLVATYHVRASAHLALGDATAAHRDHLDALRAAQGIGHRAARCEAVDGLALVAFTQGSVEEAATLLRAATAERERIGVPRRPDDVVRISAIPPLRDGPADDSGPERFEALVAGLLAED